MASFSPYVDVNGIVSAYRQPTFLAVKEPSRLDRQDGKRPDGLTLIPWHGGRSLVWDVSRQPISCFLR